MTCMVGLVKNGTVFIGSDSAATNDDGQQTIHADPNVFHVSDFLFGPTR